ncbi:MAG TPA: ubiquinol-cytochrome c reductase iron-sulfur subunit [Gammaproteobacteria bacterium]
MSKEGVDKGRRRFLTAATAVVGAAGAVGAVIPFVVSMQPSARAQAAGAPVEADISKLEPGQMMTVEWRGKPVWIVRRTEQNLADLPSNDPRLLDPNSDNTAQQPEWAKNEFRSLEAHKEILVLVGICTHLGCSPTYRPDLAPADLGADWKGGFFCPCHGSRFDLAGRVFSGVPAPKNLVVPPYLFLSDSRVLIGEEKGAA